MLTLYRNKRKGNLNQMRIDELYQCIDCLHLDKDQIKGTGVKGRILKKDLVDYLKVHTRDKYELDDKLSQVYIELPGTKQKYWVDHNYFLDYFPGGQTIIFTRASDQYFEITKQNSKGKFISSKKHHRSEKQISKLISYIIYLETRELYVKIKHLYPYLLPDIIKYCMIRYCHLLGNDLVRKVTIIQ